jgi:cytochrome c-type biogenesis protein CcmH/NrfG
MQARTLREAGRIAPAIAEFQASIRLRPNEPAAYVELGNTYISAGQESEGVAQLRHALEADPGDPTALGILTFFAITTRDEVEARRWFARIALQPRMPQPQVARLAEAYRQTFGHDWMPDPPRE